MRLDETNARCHVLTYKEGVLSAVAHDLRIDVTRFSIDVADDFTTLTARFDAASLRVRCAIVDGRDAPSALSRGDRSKIEDNIMKEVLDAHRFPSIELTSTSVTPAGDAFDVSAKLRLRGVERGIAFHATKTGARVRVHQPDFGITPYKAMLGALRIKPDVEVVVALA
jgi:polyisoprenoid-binding protein YceI